MYQNHFTTSFSVLYVRDPPPPPSPHTHTQHLFTRELSLESRRVFFQRRLSTCSFTLSLDECFQVNLVRTSVFAVALKNPNKAFPELVVHTSVKDWVDTAVDINHNTSKRKKFVQVRPAGT